MLMHVLVMLVAFTAPASCARILMLTVIGTSSTTNNFQSFADELVKHGHEVVFVCHSSFQKMVGETRPNITYIHFPFQFETSFANQSFDNNYEYLDIFPLNILLFQEFLIELCRVNIQSNSALQLKNYDKKIDLVVFDMYMQECFLPLVHDKKAPIMIYHGNILESAIANLMNVPAPYAYVKTFNFQPMLPMTFTQRLWNTLIQTTTVFTAKWWYYPRLDRLNQQLLQGSAPIEEIIRNASVIMGNVESVWNPGRPLMPFVFDVTCSLCRPPKPLPENIQNAIDEAEDGFIIFAMGTFFQSEYFPEGYLQTFMTVFSKLTKHVIIWKRAPFENQPKNVKTFSWLPQQDLLGHPKARLFINHGGMYSIHESVYHGVPMLGIPIFADQKDNLRDLVHKDIGMSMDRKNITPENLYSAITTMLTDTRYRTNLKKLNSLMYDQPETAMERAVHVAEFLIRHKDYPQILKGDNISMSYTAYFSIDALMLTFVLILIPSTIIILIIRKLISRKTKVKQN